MPVTKKEKLLFSLFMSAFMVYGMEVYNKILLERNFSLRHFWLNPLELMFLMLIVILAETLFGGPLARKLAEPVLRRSGKPITAVLTIQVCTVCIMCPVMSMIASIIFKCGFSSSLGFVWLQTIAANFSVALLWQLLVAGPCVRFLVLHVLSTRERIIS